MTKKYKCRVEYLESTGTQYIDTGLNGKNNIDFYYKCIFTNLDGIAQCVGGNLSGAGTSTVSLYLGLIRTNGNFAYHYDGTQSPVVVMNTTVQDTPYSIQGHMWVGEQYMVVNGTKSSVGTISSTFTSSLNMYLFGINNNGLSNPAYMKLYYCKIYDNGTLARDFIPVLDNSGRPAMYDQVSGQLFYNQGTGDDFNYGRQIIPVEYLESTGTQYIDTGVILSSTNKVEALAEYTGKPSTGSSYIFGTYGSSKNFGINADLQNSGNFYGVWYNQGTITASTPKPEIDTRYKVEVSSNGIYINDTLFSTVSGTFTGSNPAYLFWANGTGQPKSIMKLYSCQMWNGSNLVRDFIPCIDENNTPFMFDKVNNTVYLNSGTGQFKFGSNVEKAWGVKKLRRKLALALASLKKKRKYYCECEYLESTGTQYIDTGIFPTQLTKAQINMQFTDVNYKQSVLGSNNGASGNTGWNNLFGINENSSILKPTHFWCQWGSNFDGSVTKDTNRHTHTFERNGNSSWTYTVDNNSITITSGISTQTSPSVMYLFACNNNGTLYRQAKVKLYYCKIWNNGVLVRDLIPVLDWDYVPCMYDKVSGQLFYNAGTGDFIAGRQIHPVEYLENVPTELQVGPYIDTGINYFADVEITAKQRESASMKAVGSTVHNCIERANATTNAWRFRNGQNTFYNTSALVTDLHTLKWKNNKVYVDGVELGNFTKTTGTEKTYLFGAKATDGMNRYPLMIYGCKLWNPTDGTLVRDYQPAIDENGVGFMFDRVTHTCFLNQGTGVFKYPARQLEYLESTGTQYIDTLTTLSSTDRVKTRCRIISTQAKARYVFGAYGDGKNFGFNLGSTNAMNGVWGTSNGGSSTGSAGVDYEIDLSSNGFFVNGVKIDDVSGTFTGTKNAYLFYNNGTSQINQANRIYYLQIYHSGTLVRDFIPCFMDGVAGMWDKENNVFYTNAGTGTFGVGKIVESRYE